MKEVPEKLCHGYIHLISVFLNHEYPKIPIVLKSMGVHKANGDLIPWQMAADFADVFQDFFKPDTQYTFGDDKKIYARLYELGNKHISESMSMVFPKDIIFIDRTFGGHFGNLCRLNAQADWRSLLLAHISHNENK